MSERRGGSDLVAADNGVEGIRMLLESREAISCQVMATRRELKKTHSGTCMASSAVRFVRYE